MVLGSVAPPTSLTKTTAAVPPSPRFSGLSLLPQTWTSLLLLLLLLSLAFPLGRSWTDSGLGFFAACSSVPLLNIPCDSMASPFEWMSAMYVVSFKFPSMGNAWACTIDSGRSVLSKVAVQEALSSVLKMTATAAC